MSTLALGHTYSEFRLVWTWSRQCYYVKTGLQLKKHHIAWWYCGFSNPWGVYRFEEKEKKMKINYIWFFFNQFPLSKAVMPLKRKRLLGVKFYSWLKDWGEALWTGQYVILPTPIEEKQKTEGRMWRRKRGKWK